MLIYVGIESLIGLFGIVSLGFLSFLGRTTAGSDYGQTVLYTGLFLLVPTVLMGSTLPIAVAIQSRWQPDLIANVSLYYFVNTMGASFGALICSYLLISFFGLDGAVYAAVATNILLACGILVVAARAPKSFLPQSELPLPPEKKEPPDVPRAIWLLLFVNGFFAIGYQIVWYRIVGVLLKDSVYSFSTILCVYLCGIGLGSLWVEIRNSRKPRKSFDRYLMLNAIVGLTAVLPLIFIYLLAPHFPLSKLLNYISQIFIFPEFLAPAWEPSHLIHFAFTLMLCIFWPLLILFVSSFFMGAAFPVGIALFSSNRSEKVGMGYFLIISGNTLGGLVTLFVLLPHWGSIGVVLAFAAIQFACLMLMRDFGGVPKPVLGAVVLAAICTMVAAAPSSAQFYGRIHPQLPGAVFYKEGVEGVAMAYRNGDHMRVYINGSWHGYRPNYVTTNMALEGLTYQQDPRRVLVVGFGIGGVVRALLADDRINTIDVVELNRTSVENLIVSGGVRDSIEDPRVKFYFDDGRRYLERNVRKYDIVAMDPLRSRSAFSNNIYSVEYFELVKRNLAPNGIVLLWTDDTTGTVDKTVASVFDDVHRYGTFLVASNGEPQRSMAAYEKDLAALGPDYVGALRDSRHVMLCGRDTTLARVSAQPNTGMKPRTEFYLGNLFRPRRFFEAAPCNRAVDK